MSVGNVAGRTASAGRSTAGVHSQTRAIIGHLWLLGFTTALAAVLRFAILDQESLWFDEAFSVSVAQWNPLHVIFNLTQIGLRSTDRNLFHLLLHYAQLLSHSEYAIRGVSALSGVLTVLAVYGLGARLFGRQVGLLAALLMALSPMHLWYSREARGYALLTLLGVLAAYFMLRALADNKARSWLVYGLLAAGGVYTHSFGVLVVGALNVFVVLWLLRRRLPRPATAGWLVAQVLLLAALLPFLSEFLGQPSSGWGAWIGDKYGVPALKDLVTTVGVFSYSTAYDGNRWLRLLGLLVFAVPCLAALSALARDLRRRRLSAAGEAVLFVLIYLGVPIGALFAASQLTPLFLVRYLLPFLPAYVLLVSYGILALPRPHMRRFATVAVVLVMLPAIVAVYQGGQKENWRAGAAYVAQKARADDLIVFYDAYINIPFEFYYAGEGKTLLVSRFAPDEELVSTAALITARYDRLWLVLSHADGAQLTRLVEARPGVRRTAERDFNGLQIVQYQVGSP